MYSQIPYLVIIGILSLVILSVIITLNYYRFDFSISNYVPVLLATSLVIMLPSLLGYVVRYGDPMMKLGNTRDLLVDDGLTAGLTSVSKYPLLHSEIGVLSVVTSITPQITMGYIFLFLFTVYMIVVYILSRRCGIPPTSSLLLVPLVISYPMRPVTPSSFAYLTTFPLLLYVFLSMSGNRKISPRWWVLFVLLSITLWIQHLMIAILFFAVLLLSFVRNHIVDPNSGKNTHIPVLIINLLIGFVWLSYSWAGLFKKGVLSGLQSLGIFYFRSGASGVPDGGLSYLFNELGLSIIDLVKIIAQRFGGEIILFLFAGAGTLYILFNSNDKSRDIIWIVFIFGGFLSVAELTIGGVPSLTWRRVLRLSAIVSPILGGLIIHKAIVNNWLNHSHINLPNLISFLLIVGILLTFSGMYSSPRIVAGNSYSVDSETEGWSWYLTYSDPNYPIMSLGTPSYRFAELHLNPKEERYWATESSPSIEVPPHFEIINNTDLQKSNKIYYIDDRRSRLMNTEIGYTEDFTKEELKYVRYENPDVNVVYSNGYMNVSIFYN